MVPFIISMIQQTEMAGKEKEGRELNTGEGAKWTLEIPMVLEELVLTLRCGRT